MEETNKKTEKEESPKLSPASTVILTIIATLGTIVLLRAILFIMAGF